MSHSAALPRRPFMDFSRSPESLSAALSEIADLAAGLGILLLPLFPLAVPVMALLLGPLILIGLVAALLAIPLAPPILLARAILRRRPHAPRRPMPEPWPTRGL